MTIIVTACSNRKRKEVPAELRASSLPEGPLENLVQEWLERIGQAESVISVQDLYAGRSFRLAQSASRSLGAKLYFVSAGLGMLGEDASVPIYDLTVSPTSPQNVLAKATDRDLIGPADWWRELTRRSHLGTSMSKVAVKSTPSLILIGLPSTYVKMLDDDLAEISDSVLDRLRLFCGSATLDTPARLAPFVMPYDNRFDGPDSPVAGTRSDFAARAMWHFAETVLKAKPKGSASDHAKAVKRILSPLRHQSIPTRSRHSDEELLEVINQHLESTGGAASRMLRLLRDDLGIACEQSRLSRLVSLAKSKA